MFSGSAEWINLRGPFWMRMIRLVWLMSADDHCYLIRRGDRAAQRSLAGDEAGPHRLPFPGGSRTRIKDVLTRSLTKLR